MKRTTPTNKFSLSMRLLHWIMAALIIGLLALGLYMAALPMESTDKFALYHWHRAFGVLAFILVFIRLVVRVRSQIPEIPSSLPLHERIAAKTAQYTLYGFMLSIPVVGYIASSAVPDFPGVPPLHSIWFFGIELPLFPIEKDYNTTKFMITIHKYLAYGMIGVLCAHIAGALKHRFFDRPENDVLGKMI
ncbi:cytochrome b [Photobacterium kasasachensis]|uniref:cytochrome b n=1 Tax=Photobacterium kasasachensis TaxID=2910240 RepID=UPI003D127EB0